MITETYLGRKIRIVKGQGRDFGYSRVRLNGVELGRWLGDENKVLSRIRGAINGVEAVGGINGDKYGAEWYTPGTFETCENGHPREIGGLCLHSYCIARRPVTEPAEPVFTVKLYYAAGAFEAPTGPESLCRTVFEEALSNERVIAAELCGPDKRVLEAFGRTA